MGDQVSAKQSSMALRADRHIYINQKPNIARHLGRGLFWLLELFFFCFFFWNAIGGHQFHFDISHVHFYSFSPYPLFFSGRCAMRNRQLFIYFFNLSHISRSIFLLLLIFPFLFFMTHFPIST